MESRMLQVLKLMTKTAALGAVAAGMVSCASLPAGQADIVRVERKLDQLAETVESYNRQTRGEIATIHSDAEANASQIKTNLDDISKQMNQQQGDVKKLQDDVAWLRSKIKETPTPPTTTPGISAQATDFVSALNAGKTAFSQQNFPAARDAFTAALNFANADAAANPEKAKNEQVQANYWLGEAAFALRDFPAATQAYREVIKLDKKSINAWQSYERLGDIDVANGNNAAALQKYQAILDSWKGQNYEGASQIQAKIARIQQGGGAAPAPSQGPAAGQPPAEAAPGMMAPPAGAPPAGSPAPGGAMSAPPAGGFEFGQGQ